LQSATAPKLQEATVPSLKTIHQLFFSSWSDRIDEKCLHTGPIYAEKRLALWRLADIK
jgi:hypothetical protein